MLNMLGDKPTPIFNIGDHVERKEPRSYVFPGVIIGVSTKLNGKTILYTVECIAPGVTGMAHEFTENTLQLMSDKTKEAINKSTEIFNNLVYLK